MLYFAPMKDGIEILVQKVKSAPSTPGVYRMLNEKGDVLYVGKAKNLKKRLTNYTQPERQSNRIRKMVFETRDLVLVECPSESEALLLEISLIKSLKPRYNVIFRDDTSYPSILITDEETPRITHHRGAKKIKGDYFGPYPSADAMYRTIDLMERSFLLRTCKDSVFNNRSRPCLKYHIKRCSAPCVNRISAEAYDDLVSQSKDFLNGKADDVQQKIKVKMLEASDDMRFEDAAIERDRLRAITQILGKQSTFTQSVQNADVVALHAEGGKACVQIYVYRNAQHIGNAHFMLKEVEGMDESEILAQFMALHYDKNQLPKQVLTSHEIENAEVLEEAFSELKGTKVQISCPQRGEKKDVVLQAQNNAKQQLQRKLSEGKSWNTQLQTFAKILSSEKPVNRVETFDISNISGKNPVASLVVAGEEGMLKSDYRKFNIKTKDTPDDYAMMEETLHRRYSRLLKESDAAIKSGEPSPPWPDVVMVDGGKGHLNVLIRVFENLGILDDEQSPILCCIAKGEERDKGLETIFKYEAGEVKELPIEYNSPLIFVLQRMRDESHRFAIGFHRQKRNKSTLKSKLDDIPNVGPKRKKALLLAFGSVEGVRGASVKDIARIEGVSEELAEQIKSYLS